MWISGASRVQPAMAADLPILRFRGAGGQAEFAAWLAAAAARRVGRRLGEAGQ